MEDKRRFRRIPFKDPVQFRVPGQGESEGCVARDLSETGIRLNSSLFVPLRQKLALTLQTNGDRPIDVEGRVAWVQRVPHSEYYQIGVEFEPQAEKISLIGLKQYIQSREQGRANNQGEA